MPAPVYQGPWTRQEALVAAEQFASAHGGWTCDYRKATDSMWPVLDQNVWIVYRYWPERLAAGQIILVGLDRHDLVIHRLEEIRGDYLRLRGIHNPADDPWIHKSLYQGTLITFIPFAES